MSASRPSVLFVCSGNTCRSPMAAALFLAILDETGLHGWRVESAGTNTQDGLPISAHAASVLAERGISEANHRSRQVTPAMAGEFDLILALSPNHKAALLEMAPDLNERVLLIGELCGSSEGVEDPYGLSLVRYRETAAHIERLLRAGLNRVFELVEAK